MHYQIVLFAFIFGLVKVNTQWDNKCQTPDHRIGTCIDIYQCQPVLDLLTAAQKPVSPEIRNRLVSYKCGLNGSAIKVCCPNAPNISTTFDPSIKRLDNHRNVDLLKGPCGSVQTSWSDKFLHGNKTILFEFPWMVLISHRIENTTEFRCEGTLINDRYVLTAAHCITNLGNSVLTGVRLGEYDISKELDCETEPTGQICTEPVQDITIEEVIPHPQYNNFSFSNDIGLLRLGRKANITESVNPICLPLSPKVRDPVQLPKVIVTGWGRTKNGNKSNVLLNTNVQIISLDECQKNYEKLNISSNHLCASYKNYQNSCVGNEGGPILAIGDIDNVPRYIQYGVLSFELQLCGVIRGPSIYIKISSYLDWILDNMKP